MGSPEKTLFASENPWLRKKLGTTLQNAEIGEKEREIAKKFLDFIGVIIPEIPEKYKETLGERIERIFTLLISQLESGKPSLITTKEGEILTTATFLNSLPQKKEKEVLEVAEEVEGILKR